MLLSEIEYLTGIFLIFKLDVVLYLTATSRAQQRCTKCSGAQSGTSLEEHIRNNDKYLTATATAAAATRGVVRCAGVWFEQPRVPR